jgi:hypothetical protein
MPFAREGDVRKAREVGDGGLAVDEPLALRCAAPASGTLRDDRPDRKLLLYCSLWSRIEDSAAAGTLTLPGRDPGLPDDETVRRAFRETCSGVKCSCACCRSTCG